MVGALDDDGLVGSFQFGAYLLGGMTEGNVEAQQSSSLGSYDAFVPSFVFLPSQDSILFVDEFASDPLGGPSLSRGTITGAGRELAWQGNDQTLRITPGLTWRSPSFDVNPLGYVRLSFRAKLDTSIPHQPPSSQSFNRNELSFVSINLDASWNLDAINAGPTGGDLIADDFTSLIGLGEQWTQQIFYSRAQANAKQMAVRLGGSNIGYFIDDVRIESVSSREEVADWADSIWDDRPYVFPLAEAPTLMMARSIAQQQRIARTLAKLRSGQEITIVLLGDSIVNDLSNSAFDVLLERKFPGARVNVITAVGGGTGMDQWNPQNDTYPFLTSTRYRGALNFNDAVIEQEPDLILLGGISNPPTVQGYEAFQAIIDKLSSPSVEARLGYRSDLLLATGAFGNLGPSWYPSSEVNDVNNDYRGNLLRLANENNIAFLDLAGPWGEYLLATQNAADPSAITSQGAREGYWRDAIHGNTFGKQILGRTLIDFLSQGVGVQDVGTASFSISGTAVVGQTLAVVRTASDPDGDGTPTYSWQTFTAGSWNTVATTSTYLISSGDEGKQLRAVVTYSDGRGFNESVATAAVQVPLLPTLAIVAPTTSVLEGNIGSTPFAFSITRSGDLAGESRVSWAVAGSGANPATASDFAGGLFPAGTAVFAPGQSAMSLAVNVVGDGSLEPDEGFRIDLSSPFGARLSSTTSTPLLQILNDDLPAQTFSFTASPSIVFEGGTFAIGVVTTNVAANTRLYWQASGAGITASDFSSGGLSGEVLIGSDGRASFTRSIAADAVVDPDETLEIRFYSDAVRSLQVGNSLSLTIKEPSVGVITNGNDIITGTAAGETISGVPTDPSSLRGRGSLDQLTGRGGNDLFVLGDASGAYYNDGQPSNRGTTDMAIIRDFSSGDRIQLWGDSSRYSLVSALYSGRPGVRIDLKSESLGSLPEAIGFVQGSTLSTLSLINSGQFTFV